MSCFLSENCIAENVKSNIAQGVDGAITLANDIHQFVINARERCAKEKDLGLLLRDTMHWSQKMFVDRWFYTVSRSMAKASVRQVRYHMGGTDPHEYFTYLLADNGISNADVRVSYELEFQVMRIQGVPNDETARPITACDAKLVFEGQISKDAILMVLDVTGSDMTNLMKNALFLSAIKTYPTLKRMEIKYESVGLMRDKFWPYGFTGKIWLKGDTTNPGAVLGFKSVKDYDFPLTANGKAISNMNVASNTVENYVRWNGKIECEVLEEFEASANEPVSKGSR